MTLATAPAAKKATYAPLELFDTDRLLDADERDIAATVRGLTERGVVFLRYDGMDQDESGVWTTPGGDKIAWFTDPDGNVLSLTRFA